MAVEEMDEGMKEVAAMMRKHLNGIVARTQTRQTTGFIEAINGLFQAAPADTLASKP